MNRGRVLVTGGTGFIGSALLERLFTDGRYRVRAVTRRLGSGFQPDFDSVYVADISPTTDWKAAVADVNFVVHLAGRVHVMRDLADDPLKEFRYVNVEGTLNLAREAAAAQVRRFVFLSSVKVNGEGGDDPYDEDDPPRGQDPYAVSKHEAEAGLRRIAAETGMEIVIIRSPLVYGPGVKANFEALMSAVARGIPLPFGAIHNRRSFVSLDNLVDFIITCINHPAAANETFMVSDNEDLSTAELIRRLAHAMGRLPLLVRIPGPLLAAGATLLGKRDVAQRLLGPLQVDTSKARELLGWTPPMSVNEALRRTVKHYLQQHHAPQKS